MVQLVWSGEWVSSPGESLTATRPEPTMLTSVGVTTFLKVLSWCCALSPIDLFSEGNLGSVLRSHDGGALRRALLEGFVFEESHHETNDKSSEVV